jgi:hypothetical protein
MVERELFGGALRMQIPPSFDDVSMVRQVGDSQEIFADATTDQSFIVEMLSYTPDVSDEHIAEYLFKDIAEVNGASQTSIKEKHMLSDEDLPNFRAFPKSWILGQQVVGKYGEQAQNLINVYLAVIRIPNHETDLVVTFNDPVVIHPQSSSAVTSVAVGGDAERSVKVFTEALKSLCIKDWSIFG